MEPESNMEERKRRRRKRRRRSEARELNNSLSILVDPVRHVGASPAEDGDIPSSRMEQNNMAALASRWCCSEDVGTRRRSRFSRGHRACRPGSWTVTQKSALVQLNELRPGLRYHALPECGPLHAPLFSVRVEVDGCHFEGRGPTKREAKLRAAELALRSFLQFPNAPQAHAAMGCVSGTPLDFTKNNLDVPDALLKDFDPPLLGDGDPPRCSRQEVFSSIYNRRRLLRFTLDLLSSTNPKTPGAAVLRPLSPAALLNELRPGLRYACVTERVPGRWRRSFVMAVWLEGRVFEGCGYSKRGAKAQAAAAALRSLYSVSLEPERRIRTSRDQNQLPQFFAESIFHLVREKYVALRWASASLAPQGALAGIVMTTGLDLRSAQVVALATGTKCLDSTHLGGDGGRTLSDCHAEVVSRRSLVRFLYAQLELLLLCPSADTQSRSVFILDSGGGVRLRDGILFHMYMSWSPCGDARLNCPYEPWTAGSSRFQARLRSKVSGGEGTLPVTAGRANQKPPSSMSCTDKMAKWSIVGLQGALLSHLVEPVYLHSLTVGTLSHTGHLSRAVTRRLAPANQLPPPYRRRLPLLGCLGNMAVGPAGKSPGVSLNWSLGDEAAEEVSCSTGRTALSGMPSRLCRRSLFARWIRLQQVSSSILGPEAAAGTYCGFKMAAGGYWRAVQQLHAALQGAGLGRWRRKPSELDSFSISQCGD